MSEVFSLGEVVRPNRPRVKPESMPNAPFIGMEHVEAHTMKLLGTVPAATMKSSAVHFKPGDVLYGRLRPYLNKVFRPTFEGLCSAEFIVFPENERIDGRYLQYFLNSGSFVRFATHLNAGDRPRVDFDQIAPYPIPVPTLERQREIVAELEKQFSRLDEAVANLQRVKTNLKRCKASVLKAAVEGRLTNHGPECFQRLRLGDVVSLNPRLSKGSLEDSTRVSFVPMAAVGADDGYIDSSASRVYSDVRKGYTYFSDGDVLFAKVTPCMENGKIAVATSLLGGYGFGSTEFHVLRPRETVDSQYVYCLVSSESFRKEAARHMTGAVGLRRVPTTFLETVEVLVPSLSIQQAIVAEVDRHLSIIREVEAEVDANLQRAQALRQATLAKAFT